MRMSACFSMRRSSLRSIRTIRRICWLAPIWESWVRAMGAGPGCPKRATSSSGRCLRSSSLRTARRPCARQPMVYFVAIRAVGCAPKPRGQRSGHARRMYPGAPGPPPVVEMTTLVAIPGSADVLAAVIDGRAMISPDGARSWRIAGLGDAAAPVDTVATHATRPQRIWAAAGGKIAFSDDLGSGWRSVGRLLPEAKTTVRGIVANADATTIVVSSDRGIYRSEDGGESWARKEKNLPIHIEAGPLARDPNDPAVIYAVFSLMPYSEVWRMAIEGGNLLARVEPIRLAGGLSFLALVMIGGGLAALHLLRRRAASTPH